MHTKAKFNVILCYSAQRCLVLVISINLWSDLAFYFLSYLLSLFVICSVFIFLYFFS